MIGRAVQCLPLCVGWTITSCSCATGTLRVYFPYVGRLTPVSSVWVRVVHLEFTILGKRLGNGRRMISTIDCGLATSRDGARARARARRFEFRFREVHNARGRGPGLLVAPPRAAGSRSTRGRGSVRESYATPRPGAGGGASASSTIDPFHLLYRSREHGPAIRL